MASIYSSRGMPQTTWANRPALTAFPAFSPIVFTDIGASATTANKGTAWYHDNTSWRPVGGCAMLYTLGSAFQDKLTNVTTEEIKGQVLIPAGLWATVDHKILVRHTLTKSGTSNTATYTIRLGTAGTTSDTLIIAAAAGSPTGTSRQGQNDRYFVRDSATTVNQPFSGNAAYDTTTATPTTSVTVSNMDSNALYLSMGIYVATGTETTQLRQFDVYMEA